jgi:hypothetical protein
VKTGVAASGRATPIVELASSSDADLMFSATLAKGIVTWAASAAQLYVV